MAEAGLGPLSPIVKIVALAAVMSAAWLLADDTVIVHPSRADIPAPSLVAGREIVQIFVPPTDGLEAISIRLATFGLPIEGNVEVQLRGPAAEGDEEPAQLIAEWSVAGPTIENTLWRRLALPAPATGIAGRELSISISRSDSVGNAPTVMLSEGDVYLGGSLTIDGAPFEGDLDFLLELRPGRIGRSVHLLQQTGYPAPFALTLVVVLVASALGFLYRSVPMHLEYGNEQQGPRRGQERE